MKLDDVALKDTAPSKVQVILERGTVKEKDNIKASKVQVILDRGTVKEKDNIKAHRGIQGPSDVGEMH